MSTRTVKDGDSYVTKIVKYVPAESIVLATGFFAAFSPTAPRWVLFWVLVFALANWGYLYGAAHLNDKHASDKHFYVLATVAFVLWSMAAIDGVAKVFGLVGGQSDPQRAWVLGVATGVVPMLDSLVKRLLRGAAPPESDTTHG